MPLCTRQKTNKVFQLPFMVSGHFDYSTNNTCCYELSKILLKAEWSHLQPKTKLNTNDCIISIFIRHILSLPNRNNFLRISVIT